MSCGHSLETPCPNCATALPSNAKFCFNCGFEIEPGATTGETGKSALQITDEIAEAVTRLGETSGERRTITMLFCDVTGSTAAAEQLDPEAWSSVMREAFDAFIAPVERYEGTVARLLGDAILAYFGAPTAHEDDPERAVLAALDILEASNAMAGRIGDDQGIEFGVRIGINTGLVVVGDVGSDLFGEYAALGDAANVAARMEHTAEPNTIQIAEATHRLVEPVFEFEPIGDIEVKGKSDPIVAYRVVGVKKERGRQRGIEGLESPMVGREKERDAGLAAFDDLQSGRGRILSIQGEAGLGKSRLSAELQAQVDDEVRWLEGRSFSYDVATPYGPFIDVLARCFELDGVAPSERYPRVQQKVIEALGDEPESHAVYLAALLGVEVEGEDASLLEYLALPVLRQRTFAAVAAYFAGLAGGRPTVLVLEDLHWADPTSIELTQALMPLTDEVPLMLLLQFRPRRDEPSWQIHEAAARDFAHRYTAIELEPLDGAASEELIANLLKVEGLTDSVRALILNKAEGNPFFVEEVIRSLLDAGIIVGEDDRFVATSDIDTFAVPDTLAAVLATRLDALPPEERKVVQAAAVIGREFSFDMLEELTDVGVDLDQVVRDLLRREIVVDEPQAGPRSYFFKHALTRDTAYETLLQGVRTDLHRLVGKLIEERDPDRVTELAYHFTEAGEPSLAFPYLVAAGDVELHAFAALAAVAQYRKALEAFGTGDDANTAAKAYEGLAQALIFSGDIPGALETYGEMLAFGEREVVQEIQVSALNKRALTHTNITGDLVSAEADLLLARKIGEACGYQAGIAEFHTVYCALNTVQGNLDTAEEHLKDAVELGTEIDSTFTRNFGLAHHAQTLALMGRFAEAEHAIEEALPIIEADGDRLHHGEIIGITRSIVRANLGDPEGGLGDARWGAGELNEIGAIFVEPIPTLNAAFLAMQLGLLEESFEAWQRTMAIGEMFGDNGLIAGAAAGMAAVRTFIYGPADDEVRRLKDRATTHVAMPGGEGVGHVVLATLARLALMAFDVETAKHHLVAVEPMRSPLEALIRPEILMAAADIAMAEESAEDAAGFIDELRQLVQERGAVILEPRAVQYEGLLQVHRGAFDDAVRSFDAAVDQARSLGLLSEVLGIQFRAAMMLGAAGRAEAQRFGEGAADTVAEIAALVEDAELRKAFLRTNATS
jgi:class 3 adenylate cyclase/tetratricopeptide (TPR) repeat protein